MTVTAFAHHLPSFPVLARRRARGPRRRRRDRHATHPRVRRHAHVHNAGRVRRRARALDQQHGAPDRLEPDRRDHLRRAGRSRRGCAALGDRPADPCRRPTLSRRAEDRASPSSSLRRSASASRWCSSCWPTAGSCCGRRPTSSRRRSRCRWACRCSPTPRWRARIRASPTSPAPPALPRLAAHHVRVEHRQLPGHQRRAVGLRRAHAAAVAARRVLRDARC